ncbi:MAG: hypothetical protein ACP5G4_05605 [bacterium]
MNKLYLLPLFFVLTLLSSGWQFVFDGGDDDRAYDVIEYDANSLIVTGSSQNTLSHAGGNIFLIKLHSDSSIDDTTGFMAGFARTSIIKKAEDGFVIVGTKYDTDHYLGDCIYVLNIDRNCNFLWDKYIYMPFNNFGTDIVRSPDDCFVVTGECYYHWIDEEHISRLYLGKLSEDGEIIWEHVYGVGSCRYTIPKLKRDQDRGYITISRKTNNAPDWNIELYLMKTNPLGDSLWSRTYSFDGDGNYGWSCDVVSSFDGGYVVAGSWDWDFYIMKLNSDGDILWRRTYGSPHINEGGSAIIQLPDSGYAIIGHKSENPWLLRFDSDGDTMWTREIGTSNPYNSLMSIEQTSDGGFIMAGYIGRPDPFNPYDIWVVKTDSLGYTSIEETPNFSVPQSLSLSAYPNPFNSAVTITAPAGAEIEMFDVNGRRIDVIARPEAMAISSYQGDCHVGQSPPRNDGVSELVWRPDKSLGSGIYLVRAKIGDRDITKRVVYLK